VLFCVDPSVFAQSSITLDGATVVVVQMSVGAEIVVMPVLQ
jgi:hypothetical protein